VGTYLRKNGLVQGVVLLFVLALCGSAVAAGLDGARVLPEGKLNIFERNQKVGELSSEAPLPVGKMLQSSRKCGVRMEGIYLVSTENTKFSVRALSGGTDIFVEQGRLYFALGELGAPLSFSTPKDTANVESAVIEVSSGKFGVKGYLLCQDGRMEIGVMEGGKLVLVNSSGRQVLEPGQRVMVQNAQAALGEGGADAGRSEELQTKIIAGAAVGAVIGGLILIDPFDDDDHAGGTSPFRPYN
jgi:hypothetical protein